MLAFPIVVVAAIAADRVELAGLPFALDLDPHEGWTVDKEDGDPPLLKLTHKGLPPAVVLTWHPMWQPDLDRADPKVLSALLGDENLGPDAAQYEHLAWERRSHERLGTLMVAHSTEPLKVDMLLADVRVALFAVDGGTAVVLAVSLAQRGHLDDRLDGVLDGLVVTSPPKPITALPYGHYDTGQGWSVDLPEHWRGLTPHERGHVLTGQGKDNLSSRFEWFLDPADLTGTTAFECSSRSMPGGVPPEVVDPAKGPIWADGYKALTRAEVGGGTIAFMGGEPMSVTYGAGTDARLNVAADEPGTLTYEMLGDRAVFRWTVKGDVDGEAAWLHTLYTTWDDRALHCIAFAPTEDDPLLAAFDAAMTSVRVTDGAAHPPRLGPRAQYVSAWPLSGPPPHPLWLFVPFLVTGLFGTVVMWRVATR